MDVRPGAVQLDLEPIAAIDKAAIAQAFESDWRLVRRLELCHDTRAKWYLWQLHFLGFYLVPVVESINDSSQRINHGLARIHYRQVRMVLRKASPGLLNHPGNLKSQAIH